MHQRVSITHCYSTAVLNHETGHSNPTRYNASHCHKAMALSVVTKRCTPGTTGSQNTRFAKHSLARRARILASRKS
ncbi:hypothetical protein CA51_08920 [Rosistilla oblonga]|nr:hypothetical protein CA51_08920 [Rosistilla oblonga]